MLLNTSKHKRSVLAVKDARHRLDMIWTDGQTEDKTLQRSVQFLKPIIM